MAEHAIVHVEFAARDPQAAGRFYSDLFGWRVETDPTFNYAMFQAPPGPGGGFPQVDGQQYQPGDVLVYVATDDIEATLRRVEELGGTTLMPKTEIPNVGWFAIFSEPAGTRAALFTAMASQG